MVLSMVVAMMGVGKVGVGVSDRVVAMPMRVARAGTRCVRMIMLVVNVVFMLVFVLDGFMRVLVLVMLGKVQPYAPRHQRARRQ